MIDVIVSNTSCPHCDAQKSIMQKSFFKDEYRIIDIGSEDFKSYDLKEQVEAVPFIVVRGDDGSVRYAAKGKLDGTSLRQIERVGTIVPREEVKEKSFNLKEAKMAQAAGLLSRSMDS